ncbi:aspartate kinase [Hyphococcus flavus]|uniref:Aspartokinase n=1 Tax=Hyphococcus flavus TaxID=1866326 RepID=A0AAE9ZCV6_9PROT|nr:aspartate kinase [Hyphococcus flavus]WDI30273.1 aspartate kinase [Hyphococcus flavus]
MTKTTEQNKHTVEKIGGTSISNTDAVLKNIFLKGGKGSFYNRVFVVSAYAGVTNLLIEDKKTGNPGVFSLFSSTESDWTWGDALTAVGVRMREINASIFDDNADRAAADNFVRERIEGVRSCLLDIQRLCSFGHFRVDDHLSTVKEMLSALGEAQSAHNTALLLRQHGVNASFIDLTGWRTEESPTLDERLNTALAQVDLEKELPILTGYAHCREGMMQIYGRGYTEATFSRVAVLTNAAEAIIHKEFHLSSADPNLVGENKVRKIGKTNYDVADQLSNMGMEAIHPRAAKGLRQADIPLRVKNTFDPDDPGTVISGDYISDVPGAEIITGRKSVLALEFFEQDMVGVKGYDTAILSALERHRVSIVSKSSNANSITHYLYGSLKAARRVSADLEEKFPSASITVRKVAVLSVIGSDLNRSGLTSTAVSALAKEGIELLGMQQPMRHVDIQFVIDAEDYDKGVAVLHRVLVENTDDTAKRQEAA